MRIETEPGQRCAECGQQRPEEHNHMLRFERGGPYCRGCLFTAWDELWGEIRKHMPRPGPGDYGYCPPLSRVKKP